MGVLSPEQLLDRLSKRLDLLKAGRGVDPRQQTLRATIEWSYDLVGEEERLLLERLSVFGGGSTLEATEEICEADIDTLQSLIDKSLLRRQGERFWMLETIRKYAAEQLERHGEAVVLADRHADYFIAFAEATTRGAADETTFSRCVPPGRVARSLRVRASRVRDDELARVRGAQRSSLP
jgi:predicted ATPase